MSRLLIALMLLPALAGHAIADPAAGRSIAKKKCQICHGIDGIAKIPIAPHLAGESQIYLETQLKAFRSGKRKNEMMSVVSKSLTDEEITNLAEWYNSIQITATIPE
ncbi:MAG: cytochrome c [Pseudomonadota bacterium]